MIARIIIIICVLVSAFYIGRIYQLLLYQPAVITQEILIERPCTEPPEAL